MQAEISLPLCVFDGSSPSQRSLSLQSKILRVKGLGLRSTGNRKRPLDAMTWSLSREFKIAVKVSLLRMLGVHLCIVGLPSRAGGLQATAVAALGVHAGYSYSFSTRLSISYAAHSASALQGQAHAVGYTITRITCLHLLCIKHNLWVVVR